MKCPQCELVHPAGEPVCRRCEIDMKTGERGSRAHQAPAAATPSMLSKIKGAVPKPAQATEPMPEKTTPAKSSAKPETSVVTMIGKRKNSLADRLKGRGAKNLTTAIDCVQCSSPMAINRKAPFAKTGPLALLALGAALLVIGLIAKAYLLLLTAVIAAALAFMYLRIGRTFWKCNACGFTIPRAS